ncbi:MAG: inositol monophosphatase family protein, partial [Rhodospirillales bacterium]
LRASLTAILPGSITVGEEEVAANPAILDRLNGDDPVWIVDPIDGTTNFSRGDKRIAVIIALVQKGVTVGGWIHDPLTNVTAIAEQGSGTQIDGQLAFIPTPENPDDIFTFSGWLGAGNQDLARRERVLALRPKIRANINLRCVGQMFLSLLRDEHQIALYHRTKPWDFAAGVLMLQEAGGAVRRLDGTAYQPVANAGPLLIAPDQASWDEMHRLIDG